MAAWKHMTNSTLPHVQVNTQVMRIVNGIRYASHRPKGRLL